MENKCFILKDNSEEIRKKILYAGISVCFCASFAGADWLDFSTAFNDGVHGVGFPFDGMTKEEMLALYKHEVKNTVWCKDVDEFINLIKEFENGKVK